MRPQIPVARPREQRSRAHAKSGFCVCARVFVRLCLVIVPISELARTQPAPMRCRDPMLESAGSLSRLLFTHWPAQFVRPIVHKCRAPPAWLASVNFCARSGLSPRRRSPPPASPLATAATTTRPPCASSRQKAILFQGGAARSRCCQPSEQSSRAILSGAHLAKRPAKTARLRSPACTPIDHEFLSACSSLGGLSCDCKCSLECLAKGVHICAGDERAKFIASLCSKNWP